MVGGAIARARHSRVCRAHRPWTRLDRTAVAGGVELEIDCHTRFGASAVTGRCRGAESYAVPPLRHPESFLEPQA